jgi:3-deoxy-D-manno-octulosonic-acid transferase
VAGSTRSGEEEKLLEAFIKIRAVFPDLVMAVAPRHIIRASAIVDMIKSRGVPCQLRSEIGNRPRTAPVVLFDTFGELFNLYSVATLVFCGASLVPLGGQNPMEPAAWGKPVFYGPSMEDFADARALLEDAGAGFPVRDADMLAREGIRYLRDPETLKKAGGRARQVVEKNRGAARGHAAVIAGLLQ